MISRIYWAIARKISGIISRSRLDYSDLSRQFEKEYTLNDSSKLRHVREYFDEVNNKVDLEIEGFKSAERQRDLSIKFHWGHHHKFSDDFFAFGRMAYRHLQVTKEFVHGFKLDRSIFDGKSVLDIGCWTGGTTLTLAMLGATRIVALEEVRKYADAANYLFSNTYGLKNVECLNKSIYEIKFQNEFDIAFFPGVIYHLSDPVVALRRIFNSLKVGGIVLVETAGIPDPTRYFHL